MRIGGLVLEVKGDFCHKVQQGSDRHGRGEGTLGGSFDRDIAVWCSQKRKRPTLRMESWDACRTALSRTVAHSLFRFVHRRCKWDRCAISSTLVSHPRRSKI